MICQCKPSVSCFHEIKALTCSFAFPKVELLKKITHDPRYFVQILLLYFVEEEIRKNRQIWRWQKRRWRWKFCVGRGQGMYSILYILCNFGTFRNYSLYIFCMTLVRHFCFTYYRIFLLLINTFNLIFFPIKPPSTIPLDSLSSATYTSLHFIFKALAKRSNGIPWGWFSGLVGVGSRVTLQFLK